MSGMFRHIHFAKKTLKTYVHMIGKRMLNILADLFAFLSDSDSPNGGRRAARMSVCVCVHREWTVLTKANWITANKNRKFRFNLGTRDKSQCQVWVWYQPFCKVLVHAMAVDTSHQYSRQQNHKGKNMFFQPKVGMLNICVFSPLIDKFK